MERKEPVFPSKVDRWLIAVLVLSYGLGMAACLAALASESGTGDRVLAAGALLVLLATLSLIVPCRYRLAADALLIRSGVIRYRVPYDAIVRVRPTRNPLASPALSLDRLRIDYRAGNRRRFVLISPRHRQSFLHELATCVPGLTLDDRGHLTRHDVLIETS
ncbi:MAG: hypothetical protein KatS3mg043_0649 [Rhodothermaceae bacterium]|nr:MAG: hypothetical protein KatS3mg043_0649 [Rhodothermaceae bacterium]